MSLSSTTTLDELSHTTLEQAAEWYALLRSGDASEQDRSRWQAWLHTSNEHRAAWRHVEDISRSFAPLQDTLDPRTTAGNLFAANARLRQRRRTLLSVGVLAGTGVLGWAAWRHALLPDTMLAWTADHRSATGEQREVTLPDGTQVRLNTASAFNVDYSATLRRIVLLEGEIFVSTATDAQRPFVVDTDQGRLRALGTRFNAHRIEDETRLAVYQGAVEVRPAESGNAAVVRSGWQTRFTRDGMAAPSAHNIEEPAWTRGILIADDLPLRDVVRELRRYRRGHIGLDDSVADLKVYGNLPLHDTDRALLMLTTALPVQLRETFPWWISLEARR
ncbi:hypothetical protein GCM10007205_10060 [Oxalicibacterium flavum]|uniref:Iron dicitrate transport regulator FecR n=1 Tax=Oxalicibacterium flavum TaxID=179467 RepID=A0A8J2XXK7_9BURK|nr:FecR family protein [Oxalicibacterium flavum]GGC02870.1 hypothetical protein GCM10007205_10060 [Oxalicibacterium flavum]